MLYSIKALYLTVCLVCISVKVPENSSPEQDQNSRSQYTGRPIRAFDRTAIRAEKEQDRQCTVRIPLRRVRVTTVAVENQYVLHTLSVCL